MFKQNQPRISNLSICIFLIVFSISGQQKSIANTGKITKSEIKGKNKTTIVFIKTSAKAVLLGTEIKLLDNNFKIVRDISNLNEQIVEVIAVTRSTYKQYPKDEYCKELKYVKIKTKEFEGIVDGRKVYELVKCSQNKNYQTKDTKVDFTVTRHYGIGAATEDGITGCLIYTPIIFSDSKSNYQGLVKMVKNKLCDSDYPYFELKDDDGACDEITNFDCKDNKYFLTIKRGYQEGGAILLIQISKDKTGQYIAEIIDYKQTTE